MITMKACGSMKLLLLLLLTGSCVVSAQIPDRNSALGQLVEAERDFAKASVIKGRNAAFVDNLAEDCLVFNGAWLTKGRQFFREQKPAPIVLKWEPEFADISESRDMGVTTGPWEVQEYRPGTPPTMKGYFLTVWQKQADGTWKVVLDHGDIMAQPEKLEHALSFPEGADRPGREYKPVDVKAVAEELRGLDRDFMSAWKNAPTAETYMSRLAPGARVMRSGELPASTPESIEKLLKGEDILARWTCAGSGAAVSGDLGYSYGIFSRESEEKYAKGSYVRIWKKQPDGKWKIAMEMVSLEE